MLALLAISLVHWAGRSDITRWLGTCPCAHNLHTCIQTQLWQSLRTTSASLHSMLTWLAVSLIVQADPCDTTRTTTRLGTHLCTQNSLTCMPKKSSICSFSQPWFSLFSTELGICKLIKVLACIRLTGFMIRWKATPQGYNRARFRLDSFFHYYLRTSRNFPPMLQHGANLWKLISLLISIRLERSLAPELNCPYFWKAKFRFNRFTRWKMYVYVCLCLFTLYLPSVWTTAQIND